MAREYFAWTDDEAELLLKVTLNDKSLENVEWESVRSKYDNIHDHFVSELLAEHR